MPIRNWVYTIPLRLRSLFLRHRVERELEEEFLYHLDQRTRSNIAKDMSPEQARQEARRAMEGLEQRKEECRDLRGVNRIENLGNDLRYAFRILRKSRAFTTVAVLSLALGIGANTAIFSLIDTLLLRPLPVPEPDRLVSIFVQARRPQFYLTYPMFQAFASQNQIFSHLCAWADHRFQMRSGADMIHVNGVLASGDYFNTLGVAPILGRTFAPSDDRLSGGNNGPVAVISNRFWSEHFQRAPGAIGHDLVLDRVHFTVIGVMPTSFFGAEVATRPDIWIPLSLAPEIGNGACFSSRTCWWLLYLGRLESTVSETQAQNWLNVFSAHVLKESLPTNWQVPQQKDFMQRRLLIASGAQGWTTLRLQFSNPLAVLMILVGLVLLIACANIANLLSARGSARNREIAVRMAIGASRARIVRQLLTESVVLSVLGGAAGVACAFWLTKLMAFFVTSQESGPSLPVQLDLHPDWRVIVFTCVMSIGCGLLFGIAPSLRATQAGISAGLKERTHQFHGRAGNLRGGQIMLATQSALSILLVAAAGLFAASLFRLFTLNPGFNPKDIALINIDTDRVLEHGIALVNLYTRLLERANALPGAQAASLMMVTPLSDGGWDNYLTIPGRTDLSEQERDTFMNLVGPRFFDVMQIPLLAGREFTRWDTANSERVGIINELAARRFFPNKDAIGAHVELPQWGDVRIVGVAASIKYLNLRDADPPEMYLPYTQCDWLHSPAFAIRTRSSLPSIYSGFRAALHELAPNVPTGAVETMEEHLDTSISRERLLASLSIFFGILALLLTAIGLYGILAYSVARRAGEIGVRMALGAQPGKVVWLVLQGSIQYLAIGIVIGTISVIAFSRLVRSLLYGIQPNDSGNMVIAVITLLLVATAAAYIPARRATNIDPALALREE